MSRYFLQSERVYLRPYQDGDSVQIAQWVNDPEVTHFMFFGQLPRTHGQVKELFERDVIKDENVIFIICDTKSSKAIGFCGLYDWHRTARKAEMRILIGDKRIWGKGIGTEVVELITWYGFDRLNLNRVYLGFTSLNEAAGRAYEKAGYATEGVLREDIFRNGRYYDSVRMAIIRSSYVQKFQSAHNKRFGPKSPAFLGKGSRGK